MGGAGTGMVRYCTEDGEAAGNAPPAASAPNPEFAHIVP
jgi:hypothetical protein